MIKVKSITKVKTKFVLLVLFSIIWCNFLFAEEKGNVVFNLSPTVSFTTDKLIPVTDAFSLGDYKFYIYSKPNNVLIESYIEIYSVIQPNKFATHDIIHIFPRKEYQDYEISNLIFVRQRDAASEEKSLIQSNEISNFIVGYSEKIKEIVFFSLEGDLVNTIDVGINSKNDLLLSTAYDSSNGDFWVVDKKEDEIKLMDITGEIILSFPATEKINI